MPYRYVACLPPGLAVTLALLYLMQALIQGSSTTTVPGDPPRPFVVRDAKLPPPPASDELPPPPVRPKHPPPRSRETVAVDPVYTPTSPSVPFTSALPAGPVTDVISLVPGDAPLVALVRIEPDYPAAAAARGLQGEVTVEFDVSAAGTVENARIVTTTHAVFNKSALRAAERFRFQPRHVDGQAVATPGVLTRFSFRLDD